MMLDKIGSWLGDAAQSFFSWLFSGFDVILSLIVDGLNGIWDVLDALWNFLKGVNDAFAGLLLVVFPYVPEGVMTVVTTALLVVLILGVVRLVRKR